MYYPFTEKVARKHGIVVTSPYGMRIINGKEVMHKGVDFAPTLLKNEDIPLISTAKGVCFNDIDNNGGLYTYVRADDGTGHLMVHLKEFKKISGSRVNIGDIVGLMGATGFVIPKGAIHVHFEVRSDHRYSSTYMNPNPFIYYYENMTYKEWLDDALAWNQAIGVKGYLPDDSRIMNKQLEDMSDQEKDELIRLYRMSLYIPKMGTK